MLFDLSLYGHHPAYLKHLIHFWGKLYLSEHLNGQLDIVISSQFCQQHHEVVEAAAYYPDSKINFVPISADQEGQLKSRKSVTSRTWRAFQEWNLCCHFASQLQSSHCLLLYFDTCLLPLVLSRQLPCPMSGIYFRPSFHYANFSGHLVSSRGRWQAWREQQLLRQAFKKQQLQTLFCLDPLAVDVLQHWSETTKVLALADPVQQHQVTAAQVDTLKQRLQLDPQRRVLLLFGALNGRKGIYELLTAMALLPENIAAQLCLLLVGHANPQEQMRISSEVANLQQKSAAQIIYCPGFLPESEVPVLFEVADIVLAPYQQHVGMSGILLQAAAAGKPVLSTNYGLMGELVRRYRLGRTVESRTPVKIAHSLVDCLTQDSQDWSDRTQMQAFAAQNSPERFASTILQSLISVQNFNH
jgi:glycosyltransferase involved in cell wall biosynthesis